MTVSNKISVLIINIIRKLIKQMVPSITQIAEKAGIKNIGQLNMQMPGTCLPNNDLQALLKIRNNLINKLNSASKKIESLIKILRPLDITLKATKTSLDIAKVTRIAANAVLLAIPPPIPVPGGTIPAGINTLKDLEELLRPIITTASNKIDYIIVALDYANSVIFKLLSLLKPIDQYLIGCGVSTSELTSTNDYVSKVNQQYTEIENIPSNIEVYKGFTLEIVEEPYSPTVNRRKAVAKNSSNIVLLSTPLSFTTDDQTLLNQIKLIIDSNDLKAN